MTKDKAMQQALEALENHEGNYKLGRAGSERQEAAITAIKEALAQPPLPVQEPVAWDKPSASFDEWWDSDRRRDTANPFDTDSFAYWAWEGWQAALAQPPLLVQEPVAYLCENGVGHRYFRWKKPSDIYKPISLYTAPPKREWVGLTDEEMSDIVADIDVDFGDLLWKVICLTKIIEATLKERNK